MGNSSSKDSRGAPGHSSGAGDGYDQASASTSSHNPQHADRLVSQVYSSRNTSGRLSRHDLAFLHIGRDRDADGPATERPRETKQEREARRAERERQARLKERERSMREESVDGGYLVTLGTYTGPEDFSKSIVRQLQIERRIAPFWKGLNDHSDSWTEAQLVAAARGLPIPAADEVPPDMARTGSQASSIPSTEAVVQGLTIPINSRSESYQTEGSANLSASHPAFASTSNSNPSSPTATNHATPPLLRGRAKTLASLAAGHKSQSPDLTPQEIRLPKDPYVNGTLIEAVLYKDAEECPICFLYYPPYLNRTRCCDQPICSECFVQIKRPDPHPPEHEQPGQERPPEEEAELLVSEVAACPFCVTPEFGVTFDPPPFRRGLVYASHTPGSPFRNPISATSSTTSLTSGATRRRATSLSANAPQVITTDRVRPDWSKKLADARAHVLRRSAAATALHNAAYMLGGQGDGQLRAGFNFNRRRRTLIVDGADGPGTSTTREGDGSGDLFANRSSSRRNRVEDLEELMMMEAIRLSIAAEEERKRKETKDSAKKAKKEAKEAKKEEKRAEKLSKKHGSSASLYHAGTNESSSTWASSSMARSSSNLGVQSRIPEEQAAGKGKQPVQDFAGFNPLSEPTSTLNSRDRGGRASTSPSPPVTSSSATEDPQRHLEESRANLHPTSSTPIQTPARGPHFRQLSNASSAASSFADSAPGSFRGDSYNHSLNVSGLDVTGGAQQDGSAASAPRSGTPPLMEPMFNFRSLAAMIGEETEKPGEAEHIEHIPAEDEVKEPSPTGSPRLSPVSETTARIRAGSPDSSGATAAAATATTGLNAVSSSPTDREKENVQPDATASQVVHESKAKDLGEVSIMDHGQTAG